MTRICVFDEDESNGVMMPAHIGYVLARYPVLSETFIHRELIALSEMGLELSIYAFAPNPDAIAHPATKLLRVPVYYLPESNRRWFICTALAYWLTRKPLTTYLAIRDAGEAEARHASFGALHLARLAVHDPPAHFHAHFLSSPAAAAQTMARLLGRSFSATAHAHDVFLPPAAELSRRIDQAAWVRTISRFNRQYLSSIAAATSQSKIEVLRVGVDLSKLAYAPPLVSVDKPVHIVSVGRLVDIKGMDVLLHAVARLPNNRWTLSIAGTGPGENSLRQLAIRLGIQNQVDFLGPLTENEVISLIHQAHIFALASRKDRAGNMDGIPVVLMEALACGIPSVSTTVSGIPELLGGGAGLLVSPEDPAALADALSRLMTDTHLRASLCRRGRARIERGYDLAKNSHFLATRLSGFL